MKILITGSTSKIGEKVADSLMKSGHEIIALGGRQSELWRLGNSIPQNIEADILIHLAHDRYQSEKENEKAIFEIIKSFQGYKLLISSLSAHRSSQSIYGKSKFKAEVQFVLAGGGVIRAGAVIGETTIGVFKIISSAIDKLPIVPLPFAGRSRFFVTHIDDLCKEVELTIKSQRKGIVFGANIWPITFRKFVLLLASNSSLREPKLLLVPVILTNFVLLILKPCRRLFPSIDSLFSLKKEVSNAEIAELLPPYTVFRNFQ